MATFTDRVTFKGNPITLLGEDVPVGATAPDFTANVSLMETMTLSSLRGKVVVLTTAPSVDTGICALQLKAFNAKAAELSDDVVILYASLDLPFALGRFCAAEGIKSVRTISDYKFREIGPRYGLYMEELGLLARATFVIGRDGKVVYREIVPEMTHEPKYDPALEAVKAAL